MAALKASRIFHDEHQTVIVVESVDVQYEKYGDAFGVFAKSKPVAIVVSVGDRTYALDVHAEPMDLDRLLRDAQELNALLAS